MVPKRCLLGAQFDGKRGHLGSIWEPVCTSDGVSGEVSGDLSATIYDFGR